MGWEKYLSTIVMFGIAGGVVAGMEDESVQMNQADVRRDDGGAALLAAAQDDNHVLGLVVDLGELKKGAPRDYQEMHSKLTKLLHLEQTLEHQPRRPSWSDAARFYQSDVRTACRRLIKHMAKTKQKDPAAYPNAADLWKKLQAIATQAKDSAWNIDRRNLELHTM